MTYYDQILASASYISQKISVNPDIAIVLGTGLGSLAQKIDVSTKIPYSDIPNFPQATVEGHEGALILGTLEGKQVIAQAGRFHYYEGYNMKEVTLPIRVFKALGAKVVFIASAVGGIHENYEAGDISIVNDHINLHVENPLRGPNDERLGVRFPDMVDAYSPRLIQLAHRIAREKGITLHNSIYGGLPGPNIETKAEYNYLHKIGATVVGMSTVPEVLVAQHAGMEICVFTAITNKCFPISSIKKVTIDEVIDVANQAESEITSIVRDMLKEI